MAEIKPYTQEESKKKQVEDMFDNISKNYDFLNHFLSAGIDKRWRKRIRKLIKELPHHNILDVATGTADLCVELSKLPDARITGLDLSSKMLEVGKEKIKKLKLDNRIKLVQGDSENLPFEDNTFDIITVSFGVRNFENLKKGLAECFRVLKEDGTFIVLEFSHPKYFPIKQLYELYSGYIMPFIGGLFSKDKKAYKYLNKSAKAFPNRESFTDILLDAGAKKANYKSLSMGIAMIYTSKKQ